MLINPKKEKEKLYQLLKQSIFEKKDEIGEITSELKGHNKVNKLNLILSN